jgi:hypothetical protein
MSEFSAEDFFAELESRQDAVLRELDDLNNRIEQTLAEHSAVYESSTGSVLRLASR